MTRPDEDPVLPRNKDDDDTGWGDRSPSDDDDVWRLLDERPPHHDRD